VLHTADHKNDNRHNQCYEQPNPKRFEKVIARRRSECSVFCAAPSWCLRKLVIRSEHSCHQSSRWVGLTVVLEGC
jgi:hypothetical protein